MKILSDVFRLVAVFIVVSTTSCNSGKTSKNSGSSNGDNLKLVNEYKIDVPEPSGLSFAEDGNLYTVSDDVGKIYKLSLTGKILATIDCDVKDLEGISYSKKDNTIWLAEEGKRNLVNVDLKGNRIKSIKIEVDSKNENSGIEGLSINQNNQNIYCLNEKKPGLFIKIDKDGKVLEDHKLDFAKDYSGIFHDSNTDKIWIVSDKSMTITRFSSDGTKEQSYKTKVESMEGIVVDSKHKIIYVVSDDWEKLFVFEYK